MEDEKLESLERKPSEQGDNQQQTQPTGDAEYGNQTQFTEVGLGRALIHRATRAHACFTPCGNHQTDVFDSPTSQIALLHSCQLSRIQNESPGLPYGSRNLPDKIDFESLHHCKRTSRPQIYQMKTMSVSQTRRAVS